MKQPFQVSITQHGGKPYAVMVRPTHAPNGTRKITAQQAREMAACLIGAARDIEAVQAQAAMAEGPAHHLHTELLEAGSTLRRGVCSCGVLIADGMPLAWIEREHVAHVRDMATQ